MTTELAAEQATSVVVATVSDVGPGRWRTADDQAPERRASGTDVMRLLRLNVENQVGGDLTPQGAVVWAPGGSIGCDEYLVEGFAFGFAQDETYAFFLDAKQDPTTAIRGTPRLLWVWPVEGDRILTPNEGTLELSAFETSVEAVVRARP